MKMAAAYAMKKRAKKRANGGDVGGAETSTTGNKTKTGGSNPGGASTGGAGTVTITTGKIPPKGINISNVGGRTAARNAGGMDPADEDDSMMMAHGGRTTRNAQSEHAEGIHDELDPGKGTSWTHAGMNAAKFTGSSNDKVKEAHKKVLGEIQSMKGRYPKNMAEGGMLTDDGYQSDCDAHCETPCAIHEEASGFVDHEGDDVKHNGMAKHEDDMDFNMHGDSDEGAGGMDELSPMVRKIMMGRMKGFAGGGEIGINKQSGERRNGTSEAGHYAKYRTSAELSGKDDGSRAWTDSEAKKVHRGVLGEMKSMPKKYPSHFSEGGKVANEDMPMADFEENEFDVLPKEDDLEFHYTGKNSGDEDGDAQEDHDRKSVVARIMASRKKKDRMPNPA